MVSHPISTSDVLEQPCPAPAQFRAARALLDWSLVEVARLARISVSAVMMVENGTPWPRQTVSAVAMRAALETAGIRFLADKGEGMGVRFKPD